MKKMLQNKNKNPQSLQNSYKKQAGARGESEVIKYLKKNNFQILSTNYMTKCGEVDIIARTKNTIAFIEVKFRKQQSQCTTQLVNTHKQKKIIFAAKKYIATLQEEMTYRFDIALVTGEEPNITYIENAFYGSCW